mgnify:CR=1 FL=1
MIITELQQLYATHPNVEGMCKLLKDDSVRHLYCSGLCASAASLFSSVLVQRAECPFVFILQLHNHYSSDGITSRLLGQAASLNFL